MHRGTFLVWWSSRLSTLEGQAICGILMSASPFYHGPAILRLNSDNALCHHRLHERNYRASAAITRTPDALPESADHGVLLGHSSLFTSSLLLFPPALNPPAPDTRPSGRRKPGGLPGALITPLHTAQATTARLMIPKGVCLSNRHSR